MTRGKMYYVMDGKVFESIEFNGDMYPGCENGHGDDECFKCC